MTVKIRELIITAENELREYYDKIESTALFNQEKVLAAMQEYRLAERHFAKSTGYGYNDDGRDICEKIYAKVFGAQTALVRPQIVSGTHAITLCLYGVLRPGDEMISVTGRPYDTVYKSIKADSETSGLGTLDEFNITYNESELDGKNEIDVPKLKSIISERTKLIYIQRSTGYSMRPALTIEKTEKIIREVRQIKNDLIIMVDNCYGEFIEEKEPCDVGADIVAGSLIKNPGGGLAETGGYIAGKTEYLNKIAARMTTPSVSHEVGANMGVIRSYLQGLFMAPSVTANALKGAVLTAKVMETLGYEVFPTHDAQRSDIIQAIILKAPEKVEAYCKGIQAASPVDSYVTPMAWDMPGYEGEVIMAAGNFIQGASIELSADSPMKEPFIVYQQGGLTYEHVKIAIMKAISELS